MHFPWLLAQDGGGGAVVILAINFALIILMVASTWVCFTKAGKPGWASIIPIYNIVVMLEIAGKPLWWIILLLIPLVNIVAGMLILYAFAKSFGTSEVLAIGLVLLPIIVFPILAFGDAKYIGPQG